MYKDPQMTQYSVFEPRNDETLYNFGDMSASFGFGLYKSATFEYIDIDPSYGFI